MLQLNQQEVKVPPPVFEYRFHPKRQWQIDFAWPDKQIMLALEVEGGVYTKGGGGHRSISGFDANLEKYNEMAIMGWKLIRATPDMLNERNGKAVALILRYFKSLPGPW